MNAQDDFDFDFYYNSDAWEIHNIEDELADEKEWEAVLYERYGRAYDHSLHYKATQKEKDIAEECGKEWERSKDKLRALRDKLSTLRTKSKS